MKSNRNGIKFVLQTYEDRINNNNELTQKLSKRLSELQQTDDCSNGATPPPPPPPPQLVLKPLTSTLKKPPAVPIKYSVLSSPPPCPTPDYDTLSLSSSTSSHPPINKRILSKSQSETSTIRRGGRPVSVTIGEYPSMRREVGKLDFLPSTKKTGGGALNDRLTNELTQTLNRSNLKKRTESMENLIEQQRNGTVRINLNKSTNDLTNDYVNKTKSITFADDNN